MAARCPCPATRRWHPGEPDQRAPSPRWAGSLSRRPRSRGPTIHHIELSFRVRYDYERSRAAVAAGGGLPPMVLTFISCSIPAIRFWERMPAARSPAPEPPAAPRRLGRLPRSHRLLPS